MTQAHKILLYHVVYRPRVSKHKSHTTIYRLAATRHSYDLRMQSLTHSTSNAYHSVRFCVVVAVDTRLHQPSVSTSTNPAIPRAERLVVVSVRPSAATKSTRASEFTVVCIGEMAASTPVAQSTPSQKFGYNFRVLLHQCFRVTRCVGGARIGCGGVPRKFNASRQQGDTYSLGCQNFSSIL